MYGLCSGGAVPTTCSGCPWDYNLITCISTVPYGSCNSGYSLYSVIVGVRVTLKTTVVGGYSYVEGLKHSFGDNI